MNKVDVKDIDKKWQDFWSSNKNSFKNTDKKKEILLPRDVSLSFRENPYGTCQKLYYWRCFIEI